PATQEIEPLVVALPSSVTVYPETQNTLTVRIARNAAPGPIRIDAVRPPGALEIPEIKIEAADSEGELLITATKGATPGRYPVTLRARTTDGKPVEVSQLLNISIEPPPPTLYLSVSPSIMVY